MAQTGRAGRLHPSVGAARRKFVEVLERNLPYFEAAPTGRTRGSADDGDRAVPFVLVACSGGPDSMALASVAAHFARRGDVRVGAVVVDHGLQDGSAEQTERAAEACRRLGLDPVRTAQAEVLAQGMGPEMAARTARYAVLDRICREEGAQAVLLGHTLDDQAETVMLGLARGSGTRSLSGMPEARLLDEANPADGAVVIRPFLSMRRDDTVAICEAEGLDPWHDPTNDHLAYRRNLVRHEVLPFLERTLGPGISQALARTAAVLGPDAEYLELQADDVARAAAVDPAAFHSVPLAEGQSVVGALSLPVLRDAHPSMRRRVLARAIVAGGGESPSYERLAALDELVSGHGNAGPVQMAGHVSVWRRRRPAPSGPGSRASAGDGALVLVHSARNRQRTDP